MKTETKIVKELVRRIRKADCCDVDPRTRLRGVIIAELHRDAIPGRYDFTNKRRDRQDVSARLEKRIHKKLRQPFRRKKRGPQRRKAAGKNEVTRKQR